MNISSTAPKIDGIHLFEGYSDELLVFASSACIIIITVGVPGNLLTIIALSRGKQTRNSTAIFIMNLSLSDLLFDCFNLPLAASTFLQRSWTYSELLCRLFPLLRYGLLAVSLFTVSLITINRYIIIAHPRQYPRIYQRRYLALMIAGTWITSFSTMIPTWRGIWGKFGLDTSIGSCSILHDENDRSPKEFLFAIAFVVPCLCIVYCYARIFFFVRNAAIRTRDTHPKGGNTVMQNSNLQAAPHRNNQNTTKNTGNSVNSPDTETIGKPFEIDEHIEYIDEATDSSDNNALSYVQNKPNVKKKEEINQTHVTTKPIKAAQENASSSIKHSSTDIVSKSSRTMHKNRVATSLKTSFTLNSKKNHYISTSNASSIYPGKMSPKDRRLLMMILVIFISFVICYLPITITKIWKDTTEIHIMNISGYVLIYLTTCINPLIYVLMSSEYRQAYWNLLRCRQFDTKKK